MNEQGKGALWNRYLVNTGRKGIRRIKSLHIYGHVRQEKASGRVAQELTRLGVNFEANSSILSYARLPIPTPPR